MRLEEIGSQEVIVALSKSEVEQIGQLAMSSEALELAVSFKGLGVIMDSASSEEASGSQTDQLELPFGETAAVSTEELHPLRAKAANLMLGGVRKIRGVRRPKEHRKPHFTYGNNL